VSIVTWADPEFEMYQPKREIRGNSSSELVSKEKAGKSQEVEQYVLQQ
jgi:hypothetical protein